MEIKDIISQLGGIQSIARELGISEQQAASGVATLGPAILGGFKKQAQTQPSGVEGLGGLLVQLGGGSLLDNVLGSQPTDVNRGNDILSQIFGSKDVSRAVAQDAASKSGLDPNVLKKMLPMLAMVIAGYMAKQPQVGAGQAGAQRAPAGGGLGGLLKSMFGQSRGDGTPTGGLASMLDLDGDGNPLDDILRMVGKTSR
jgi:hypothetical protein